MNADYVLGHERGDDLLFLVYRVYSVSIYNILVWICEIWYTVWRQFTIDCLCVPFVGDGVKGRFRLIIRYPVNLERNTGESRGN
jgi:hypothetical protein